MDVDQGKGQGKGQEPKGEPKGKGKAPRFQITPSMTAALRANQDFLDDLCRQFDEAPPRNYASAAALVDSRCGGGNLEHLVDLWIVTKYVHRERCNADELEFVRQTIVEEWHQCILRQLLFTYHLFFADASWKVRRES